MFFIIVSKLGIEMWNLTATNVNGIRSGSTAIDEGLNVVQASNFRGKSSLIAAIRTAIGATGTFDEHPLTDGTESGNVVFETAENKHDVSLERVSPDTVKRTGNPYLSDGTDQLCARLFACLGEDNPIRKAVRNGDKLTELLQAPLNLEDIDAQIDTLKQEKREIHQRITEAEKAGKELPAQQETVTNLEENLDNLKRRRREMADEETNRERIEALSDEIGQTSGKLTNVTQDISRLEREIERKQDRLKEKKAELNELEVPKVADTSGDIEAMREEIAQLGRHIELVEDLYRANRNILDAGELDVISDVDRSIAGDELECWVCGHPTPKDNIEEYIARLQSTTAALRNKKEDVESELDSIEDKKQQAQQAQQRKDRLERAIRRIRTEVDEKKGILQNKRTRKEELDEELTALKAEIDEAEDEYNEALTEVKAEIHATETELQRERETLESLEEKHEGLTELQQEHEEIQRRLTGLRNRKKNTQEELKQRFNAIIADIIEEFQPGFSSARLSLKTDSRGDVEEIDLEIARDVDDRGHRTSADSLSEGEVELIGLVVALAGYHAFDVESSVPCILIDGISQLAAEHLRTVTTYLDERSNVVVTTAYPEAGSFDGNIIDPDEWDVVSDETFATP